MKDKRTILMYLLGAVLVVQVIGMAGLSAKRVGTIAFASALLGYAALRSPHWKVVSLLGIVAASAIVNNAGYIENGAVQILIVAVMYAIAAWLLIYVAQVRRSRKLS